MSKLPRRTVGCSNFIAHARQPQGGHELGFSLCNTSHSACPEKARFSNTIGSTASLCPRTGGRLVWLQTSSACAAASGQRHTGAFWLVQETPNTTFSSTNTLFDKTVKDSVFSQPVVNCAHKFPSFINCMSTIASLIVSLRLFVNTRTKPKRHRAQCDQQIL